MTGRGSVRLSSTCIARERPSSSAICAATMSRTANQVRGREPATCLSVADPAGPGVRSPRHASYPQQRVCPLSKPVL